MRVAMVGTGYVGLVSGACFADSGHQVPCVAKDADKIRLLTAGEIPIYEPGLPALVASNVREGRLSFSLRFPRQPGCVMCSANVPLAARRTRGPPDGSQG